MLATINTFKRHFHKCQALVEKLSNTGSFTLNFHYESEKFEGRLTTPDDELTVRFVTVLRRFLTPSDKLYYRHVWNQLYTQFSHDVPSELIKSIVECDLQLSRGQIKLHIDGTEYTAEQIYELISQGTYFDEDSNTKEVLEKLTAVPMAKLLFWNQFYSYSLNGYYLASLIFEAIKHIQISDRYKKLLDSTRLTQPQCIFCLSTDNSFNSEEHIFPESLGNEEMLLPRGIVCDKCNNELLSELDDYLVKFEPIAYLRVLYVLYDKNGKLPKANFQNMTFEKKHPRHLRVIAKDKTGMMKNEKDLGNGWFSWQMNMRGKRPDFKRIGRALYKIALETIALDHGPRKVLDSNFDIVRSFVRGESNFANNLLVKMKCQPNPQVRITYHDLPDCTPFEIVIFGLHFLINLAPTPVLQPSDILTELGFEVFPLFD